MRRIVLATFAVLLAAAGVAQADEPSDTDKEKIEAFFAPHLFKPDTTDWQYLFSRPFLGGTVWCGRANVMNSAHIYEGFHGFYVTLFADGVHQGTILGTRHDDPVGSADFKLKLLCGF